MQCCPRSLAISVLRLRGSVAPTVTGLARQTVPLHVATYHSYFYVSLLLPRRQPLPIVYSCPATSLSIYRDLDQRLMSFQFFHLLLQSRQQPLVVVALSTYLFRISIYQPNSMTTRRPSAFYCCPDCVARCTASSSSAGLQRTHWFGRGIMCMAMGAWLLFTFSHGYITYILRLQYLFFIERHSR